MDKMIDLKDLSREEVIAMFLMEIYIEKRQREIYKLLSVFTTFNLSVDMKDKYFKSKNEEQITEELLQALLEKNSKEKEAWNIVIDTLGENEVFHIIDNNKRYTELYVEIVEKTNDLKSTMLKIFTVSRGRYLC